MNMRASNTLSLTLLVVVTTCLVGLTLAQSSRFQGLINPEYKQHGGPVDEGQRELQLPDPTEVVHTSTFALKRVRLGGVGQAPRNDPTGVQGGDGSVVSFFMENRRIPRFHIYSADDTSSSDLGVGILSPGKTGAFSDVANEVKAGSLTSDVTRFTEGGVNVPTRVYRYTNPTAAPGKLHIRLARGPKTAGRDTSVIVVATSDSPYVLQVYTTNLHHFSNVPVVVRASIYDTTSPGRRPVGAIESGYIVVESGNGQVLSFPLVGSPDGWATGSFVPATPGKYQVTVHVVAVTPAGERTERTHVLLVTAVERNVGVGNIDMDVDDNGDIYLSIGVRRTPNAASKFIVYGEIFGTDPTTGSISPVAYFNGLSDVVNDTLHFVVHPDWFQRSVATAPYEVRGLRITHADTYSVLASSPRSPITHSNAPVFVNRGPPADIAVSDDMRKGRAPGAPGGAGRRLLQSNPKLLLIHGYCASAPPFPAAQFSNAATYSELNVAISHDTFANHIKTFGSVYSSFGAVAHSQGGCASLHLYTYYWSGLDYSSGNRLIQSVGTPYGGTNLAGILATLGSWFGVGCGSVNDLTYSGASSWLANIPTWARSRVYYYTTSFTDDWWSYDYCNMATDPFLSDPDDGVVEKSYAQLGSANNMGHVTGQCHTTGMRDPPQCQNSGRNSVMNANANR